MQRTTLYLIGFICLFPNFTHAAPANASAAAPTTTAADTKAAADEKDSKASGTAIANAANVPAENLTFLPYARIKDKSKVTIVHDLEQLKQHCRDVVLHRQLTTLDDFPALYDACLEAVDTVAFTNQSDSQLCTGYQREEYSLEFANDLTAELDRREVITNPAQQIFRMMRINDGKKYFYRYGTDLLFSDFNRNYKARQAAVSYALETHNAYLPKPLRDIIAAYAVAPGSSVSELILNPLGDQFVYTRPHPNPSYPSLKIYELSGINTVEGVDTTAAQIVRINESYIYEVETQLAEHLQKHHYSGLVINLTPMWKADLRPLHQCPDIRSLNLSNNNIEEIIGLEDIIPQLGYLNLECNRLSNEQVRHIQALWLSHDKIAQSLIITAQQKLTPEGWFVYLEDQEPHYDNSPLLPAKPYKKKRDQMPKSIAQQSSPKAD